MTARCAVILATAPAVDGGPAALLSTPDGPVVARTLRQLERLGVQSMVVVTRPEWDGDVSSAVAGVGGVTVHAAESVADVLRAVGGTAAATRDAPLVLVDGEVMAHDAVFDDLFNDPRVGTGVLFARGDHNALLRVRVERGRVASAESAYHRADRAHGASLGVLQIAPDDMPAFAEVAAELATMFDGPLPPGWDEELVAKETRWTETGHGNVTHARELATRDVTALLLTGLCRSGVAVGTVSAGLFPCARAYTLAAANAAVEEAAAVDADRLRLAAAVKGRDGFVTTYLVSPYSRYLARWAARRGLRPNQVTVFSMVLGVVAALLFATGARWGLVTGAVVLWAAFVADCVDGQLARYTRQFSKLGAWLDALFDRAKEYVVFAGLAAGGVRAGDDGTVWLLAAAALALQITRHAIAFSYGLSQRPPQRPLQRWPLAEPGEPESTVAVDTELLGGDAPQRRSALATVGSAGVGASRFFEQRAWLKWAKRIFVLPIGERFLAIAVVAAVWGPRQVFVVLLVWGGLALAYTVTGRLLRSVI